MKPNSNTESKIDVSASKPMLADGICAVIARIVEKGGTVVAIVPAGFQNADGTISPVQLHGTVDVQRIFWIEPHETQPVDPVNGELRIKNNDLE